MRAEGLKESDIEVESASGIGRKSSNISPGASSEQLQSSLLKTLKWDPTPY